MRELFVNDRIECSGAHMVIYLMAYADAPQVLLNFKHMYNVNIGISRLGYRPLSQTLGLYG